jgi:hypothetical protein
MPKQERAVLRHALAVYDELRKRAREDDALGLVYEGKLKDVYVYLNISSSAYTRIRRVLLGCGSIEILQRGSRYQPSIVALRDRPPDGNHELTGEDLTGYTAPARILVELQAEVQALGTWRETLREVNLTEVLRNFEDRITRLEAQDAKATKTSK